MKKLFAACHNYATTKDGSYFKELRETWGASQEGFRSRFIICETDWQPAAHEIDALEKGGFRWCRDVAFSIIQAAAHFVINVNQVEFPAEISPEMEADIEEQIHQQCETLDFGFSKFRLTSGACCYRITDLQSKLFFIETDLRWIMAVVQAAMNEQAPKNTGTQASTDEHTRHAVSRSLRERKDETFDPFDL